MIKEIFFDIFFPRFCINCKKEGRYLCESCILFLSETRFICPACYKNNFFGKRHKKCKKENVLDGLISFWDYEGVVKDLINKTKKESLIDIPKELISYGFLTIRGNEKCFSLFFDFLFDEETVISYVPLCKREEIMRGFDEKKEIAKNLAKITKKKEYKLLEKEKDCFRFLSKGVKQVVLVDDIWESGKTLKDAAKCLKEKGVKKIWGFTLAKTP
jgi:predicted amidophosphoribosyltransferase